MSRWIAFTIGLGLLGTLGCTMGANPHDCKYTAYGGLIDRLDRVNGRVGSVIDPASVVRHGEVGGEDVEPTPADAESAPRGDVFDLPEPTDAESDERREVLHNEDQGSTLELLETIDGDKEDDATLYR